MKKNPKQLPLPFGAKRGRPRKFSNPRAVLVFFPENEKTRLADVCAASGMSVSEFVRRAVNAAMTPEKVFEDAYMNGVLEKWLKYRFPEHELGIPRALPKKEFKLAEVVS